MDSSIREQYVYIDTQEGIKKIKVHPVTESKAIVDMKGTLNNYKELFIDPSVDEKLKKLKLIVFGAPVGFMFQWGLSTPPTGCIKLNGTLLDREVYSELWEFVKDDDNLITDSAWITQSNTQTSVGHFSTGDGSTTFRLPKIVDFIRGTSGTIGAWQGDAIRNMTGSVFGHEQGVYYTAVSGTGIFTNNAGTSPSTHRIATAACAQTSGRYMVDFNAANQVPTSTEIRPKNISYPYYIKACNTMTLVDLEKLLDDFTHVQDLVKPLDEKTAGFLPVGTFIFHCSATVPTGFLHCNGAAIDRTVYSKLFSVIGTTYGTGNGSTTFTLPDIRDYFVRGIPSSGRAVGNKQNDAFQNITGNFPAAPKTGSWNTSGVFSGHSVAAGDGCVVVQAGTWEFSFDASRVARTSTETRPKNIVLLPCIKF